MHSKYWATFGACAALGMAGCGDSSSTSAGGNPVLDKSPSEVTCGDFIDNGGARQVAAKVADSISAVDQSRAQIVDVVAVSIGVTCSQPSVPGVADVRDYKPVDGVLAGVQHGFDDPTGATDGAYYDDGSGIP